MLEGFILHIGATLEIARWSPAIGFRTAQCPAFGSQPVYNPIDPSRFSAAIR